MRPAASGRAAGSTLTACPAATRVFSAKAPMPSAGVERGAVQQGHRLGGVAGVEAVPGPAAATGAAAAAGGAPGEDDVVAGAQVGDAGADGLDDARGLMAEQEREFVVDRAVPVVQIGVADAAGLHGDEDFARAGVRHQDRLHLDRRAFFTATTARTSCGMPRPLSVAHCTTGCAMRNIVGTPDGPVKRYGPTLGKGLVTPLDTAPEPHLPAPAAPPFSRLPPGQQAYPIRRDSPRPRQPRPWRPRAAAPRPAGRRAPAHRAPRSPIRRAGCDGPAIPGIP